MEGGGVDIYSRDGSEASALLTPLRRALLCTFADSNRLGSASAGGGWGQSWSPAVGACRHLLFDSKGLCRIYNSLVERDKGGLGRSRLKILTPELGQERAGGLDSRNWKEFRLRFWVWQKTWVLPCTPVSQGGEGTLSSWTEGGKHRYRDA